MIHYNIFTRRNIDYIAPDIQEKISNAVLLVAGCGIGSSFAEVAVRLGFKHFILADGDVVDAHNLNRQGYVATDVGTPKVEALARRIQAINPGTNVELFGGYLDAANVDGFVLRADIIFDTIDFLDLSGIVALHDSCLRNTKPTVTALSIGWGAGCVYFPHRGEPSFRDLFGLPATGSVENEHYAERFSVVVERLAERLDPNVVSAVGKALTVMEDGAPCPASQVAPGAFAVGALAGTLVVRILAGEEIRPSPELLTVDMCSALASPGIRLL